MDFLRSSSSPFMQTIKNLLASITSNRDSNENRQELCNMQNGGLRMALSVVTENAKLWIIPFLATLAFNPTFVTGMVAWFVSQSIKVFLNFFKERKWDLRLMFSSEGIIMPSSHLALCSALSTSVALSHGVSHSVFPVSLGFSLIVLYDVIRLRRNVRYQAEVINALIEDDDDDDHTLHQVLACVLIGCLIAFFLVKLYWIMIVSLLFVLIMALMYSHFFAPVLVVRLRHIYHRTCHRTKHVYNPDTRMTRARH